MDEWDLVSRPRYVPARVRRTSIGVSLPHRRTRPFGATFVSLARSFGTAGGSVPSAGFSDPRLVASERALPRWPYF
jgi:hypothetical protein